MENKIKEQIDFLFPSVNKEDVLALLVPDRDLDEPREEKDTFLFVTKQNVTAVRERKIVSTIPMEQVEEFSIMNGVGTIAVVVTMKSTTDDADKKVIARGSIKMQKEFRTTVKCVNSYLRNGTIKRQDHKDVKGKKEKIKSMFYNFFRLAKFAKKEMPFIAIAFFLFIITTAIGLITPEITKRMTDDYIRAENPDLSQVFIIGFIGFVVAYYAFAVLKRLIQMVRSLLLTVNGNRLIVRLRTMVFEKIERLSYAKIQEKTSGELMRCVSSDCVRLRMYLNNHLPEMIEQVFLFIAVSVLMFVYDAKLALLILLPSPIVFFIFRITNRYLKKLFQRRRELSARSASIQHDTFQGIRVVKAYGKEKYEEKRFVDMALKERNTEIHQEKIYAYMMPAVNFLMGFGEYVLLWYIGSKMLAGEMTAGQMSQFSAYAGMITAPLAAFMKFPRQTLMAATSLERVYEIVDEPIAIQDGSIQRFDTLQGNIDINHISFSYRDGEEIFSDVDLHIHSGEFIGLVGRSGVGKTTLINLVMRMYDVEDGSILLDGKNIKDLSADALHKKMGVVLQENYLFSGSIMQNIVYAKPQATFDEVIVAAKAAGAHDFIMRLPDGYNTYVGEKGYRLSGGERQRIAIARALLHDPKILILDEATSALDTETEKLIQDALAKLIEGRTTIAIAHRLSTLRNATRIVVLDRKTIAEMGTHDELMEKKGIYYQLVMTQRDMNRVLKDKDNLQKSME